MRCVNRHVCSCSELSTFRNEKDFGLVNKQDFDLDFSSSVGFFEGKSAGRSTGRPSKSLFASCTTFLSKKKIKKKTIGQSKNPRTVRKKKILAGTPELERVTKDERASLYSAQQSVWNKAGPWSGCPVSNLDPNNTIGLLCFDALYPLSCRDSTAPPTHSTSLSSILEAINIIKIFKSIAPPTHIVRVYLWFASEMLSESDAFLQRSVK